ncbi:porin family protein [Pseudoalteromonas fenneropenaei]|uniref:Porin family protein n=1 Tax=Pseudoalteromonas fenneropenaei TaxID=1737459 RepID=A0ABV7CIM2_9GAMM
MKHALLISLFASTLGFATQATANEPHQIGAQLNGGSAKYKSSSQDGDGVAELYFFYNYQFDPIWSLEAGITTGAEVDDWDCKDVNDDKFVCQRDNDALFKLNANKLDYNHFSVAAKAQFELTENSDLYGKVGVLRYDYEMKNGSKRVVDEDGFGYLAEAGWQYQWQNGIGLNIALRYTDMGDLDTTTLGAGISYRF